MSLPLIAALPFFSEDEVPPHWTSISVHRNLLEISYSERLDTNSVPPTSAFTVTRESVTDPVVSSVRIDNIIVELTLDSNVQAGEVLTLTYRRPGRNRRIKDLAGNPAINFANQAVRNITPST